MAIVFFDGIDHVDDGRDQSGPYDKFSHVKSNGVVGIVHFGYVSSYINVFQFQCVMIHKFPIYIASLHRVFEVRVVL